jgi:tetratricopeptide (TPR) repeat protein
VKAARLGLLATLAALSGLGAPADALFQDGVKAYRAGDYAQAALEFRESATRQPASGTLQDLGNAEWQCGQTGQAILAWEQSRWLDPLNGAVNGNLRFARKVAQLEAPDLPWYEAVSTWLPVNWWAWLAGGSLWVAVGMTMLPGILRRPKRPWQQAFAAVGLMVFLLSVPAHIGVYTRSHLGFVQEKDVPLRLTPTREAQPITRLAAGEPARCERVRGDYLLIRTNRALGWVERHEFAFICPGA